MLSQGDHTQQAEVGMTTNYPQNCGWGISHFLWHKNPKAMNQAQMEIQLGDSETTITSIHFYLTALLEFVKIMMDV